MSVVSKNNFRFRKNERLGSEGAEDDEEFLFDCFVDTGDLASLKDTESHQSIVVGRTGSGKTALLRMLEAQSDKVVNIDPEDLSLTKGISLLNT